MLNNIHIDNAITNNKFVINFIIFLIKNILLFIIYFVNKLIYEFISIFKLYLLFILYVNFNIFESKSIKLSTFFYCFVTNYLFLMFLSNKKTATPQ